jgi:hypothetical protein
VADAPGSVWSIGTASASVWSSTATGPVKTFRWVVNTTELAGRWLCVGRRLFRLGEAAEAL